MINETKIDAFSDAVVYGDFDKVKTMILENSEIVNSKGKYGFTALHNAMSEEQFEIVEYIIKNGASVNIQNDDGIAPIHLAGYVQNAELLLLNGADINIKDNQGNNPLHILASDGDESLEVIEFLLSKGANKEVENNLGQTPLEIAQSREDHDIIDLLK